MLKPAPMSAASRPKVMPVEEKALPGNADERGGERLRGVEEFVVPAEAQLRG